MIDQEEEETADMGPRSSLRRKKWFLRMKAMRPLSSIVTMTTKTIAALNTRKIIQAIIGLNLLLVVFMLLRDLKAGNRGGRDQNAREVKGRDRALPPGGALRHDGQPVARLLSSRATGWPLGLNVSPASRSSTPSTNTPNTTVLENNSEQRKANSTGYFNYMLDILALNKDSVIRQVEAMVKGSNNLIEETSTSETSDDMTTMLEKRGTKTVLFWNPDFLHWSWADVYLRTFETLTCEPYDCIMTRDKDLYDKADAMVVHFPQYISNEAQLANELPKERPQGQQWVFYNKESPGRKPFNYRVFDNMFNVTFTYRLDSDVPLSYGVMHHMPDSWRIMKQAALPVNHAAGRKKLVAWLVSNCNPNAVKSWRMEYARELQKYIPVDIYGKCGTLPCPPGERSLCNQMVRRDYKFHLSFESSICKDYATEKLWDYRRDGLVPIVIGGYNYSSLPPKTVIDVTKFASVKDLAEYIKELDQNDDLYNQYFDWEKEYQILTGGGYCKLCEFLHKNPDHKKIYNMHEWWSEDSACVKPEVYFRGSADELIRQKGTGTP